MRYHCLLLSIAGASALLALVFGMVMGRTEGGHVDPVVSSQNVHKLFPTGSIVQREDADCDVPFDDAVTIVVKSVGDSDSLDRLVATIMRQYPKLPVVIASDIAPIDAASLPIHFRVVPLEFDVGLSVGRNMLIAQVSTPFFVLFDDDYQVTNMTNLSDLHRALCKSGAIVAGGAVLPRSLRGQEFFVLAEGGRRTLLEVESRRFAWDGCYLVDLVPNFWMGRTTVVQGVKWDETLKLGEHEDFFLRLRLSDPRPILYCPRVSIVHSRIGTPELRAVAGAPRGLTYHGLRKRAYEYMMRAVRSHGYSSLAYYIDVCEVYYIGHAYPPKQEICNTLERLRGSHLASPATAA